MIDRRQSNLEEALRDLEMKAAEIRRAKERVAKSFQQATTEEERNEHTAEAERLQEELNRIEDLIGASSINRFHSAREK